MKQNIQIQIHSTQHFNDSEPDTITFKTTGVLHQKDDKYYIKYQESEELGSMKTTLKVLPDEITLIRTGEQYSHMVFQLNHYHETIYPTIAGEYTLGIDTKKINNQITDAGGLLQLEYEITLNNQASGYNTFEITIEKE